MTGMGDAGTPDPPPGLAMRLRTATAALHVQAERSGIILEIMRGKASRDAYALYLRNLLPAYAALEAGLRRHRATAGIRRILFAELDRAPAIAGDLDLLAGAGWDTRLPVLPEAAHYAARVVSDEGPGLIGHAYARYLGDLSGAQFLRRALVRTLGLGPAAQGFFDFPAIADAEAFKVDYRAALDAAGEEVADPEVVVAAACSAFSCNIAVSEAVMAAV